MVRPSPSHERPYASYAILSARVRIGDCGFAGGGGVHGLTGAPRDHPHGVLSALLPSAGACVGGQGVGRVIFGPDLSGAPIHGSDQSWLSGENLG